jgi:hypothetical protein
VTAIIAQREASPSAPPTPPDPKVVGQQIDALKKALDAVLAGSTSTLGPKAT